MAKITYEDVQKKADELGLAALTPEEKNVLKFGAPEEEKMVDTDDYDTIQTEDIAKRSKEGKKLTAVESTVLRGKQLDDTNKFVDNVIISGHNDRWFKHYNYKEDLEDGQTVGTEFDIEIRIPNVIDEGAIQAAVNRYLVGTAEYSSEYIQKMYYALALIHRCGTKVPDIFKDDDKIYSVTGDWLVAIYADFTEWQSRFQY